MGAKKWVSTKFKELSYFLGVIALGFGFGILHASYFIGIEKLVITMCVVFGGFFCWLGANSKPQIPEQKIEILPEAGADEERK